MSSLSTVRISFACFVLFHLRLGEGQNSLGTSADAAQRARFDGESTGPHSKKLAMLLLSSIAPASASAHFQRLSRTGILRGNSRADLLRFPSRYVQRASSPKVCANSSIENEELSRWRAGLPLKRDKLDREIIGFLLPAIVNLMVVPLVNSVDTFWVGRMGNALALAGQGAAAQCFWSTWFIISFIPTITAPLVAKAAGNGDIEGARKRVNEAVFLANMLGIIGTVLLVLRPDRFLSLVLPGGAPAESYARQYLILRSLSLVPALISAIGYAAFRGMLDTVTPLKVSIASNVLNLVLDPILIFWAKMGVAGAALATAISELSGGLLYVILLLRRNMFRLGAMLQPPKMSDLLPLIKGGSTLLLRQIVINIAFVVATRLTQSMDVTGVSGAVWTVTNQIYSLGLVVMLAMQSTAAILVPSALSKGGGNVAARRVADRLIGWSVLIAASIAAAQALAVPYLAPLFSTLPEVKRAAILPGLVSALVMLSNGLVFAGEGIMMGVGAFGALAAITSVGCSVMLAGMATAWKLGLGVSSVWLSLLGFHIVQILGTMYHYFKIGPLARPSKHEPEK